MSRQVLGVYCAIAAVTVIVMVLAGAVGSGDPDKESAGASEESTSAQASGDPSTGNSTEGSPEPSTKGRDEASGSPSSGSSDNPEAGVEPNAGVEVLPAQPTDKGHLPGLSKTTPDPSKPLVRRPLPKNATSEGTLTEGFPRKVMGPSKGSDVVTSSVSPNETDESLQVALVATTEASPDSVLRTYRIRLGKLGFTQGEPATTGDSSAASFVRGSDSVVVTVTPGAENTSYTAYGTLHAAGD